MDRKKIPRPSGPLTEPPRLPQVSVERKPVPDILREARSKLLGDDLRTIAQGAFELRGLAIRGEDISMALPLIPSRLRLALGAQKEKVSNPPPLTSMRVPKEGAAKVYLSECLMLAAKNGMDISCALTVVSVAMADSDIHVRNNILLALGYHSKNGGDISLYIDLIAPFLSDVIPMNREAAVWTLKQYASKGTMQAHAVLLAIGPEDKDDIFSSDVRECCNEAMRRS